jgi:2'-5' RNA ligase
MKRTFIAVPVPVQDRLIKILNELKHDFREDKIKWVEPENLHLTLFFLGDTDEEIIPSVSSALIRSTSRFNEFNLRLVSLGIFKNLKNPSVMWIGIEGYQTLTEIKKNLEKELVKLGFEIQKRDFVPHLTLARPKWIKNKNKLGVWLDRYNDRLIQEVIITKVMYYESLLTRNGPIYKPIQEIKLKSE